MAAAARKHTGNGGRQCVEQTLAVDVDSTLPLVGLDISHHGEIHYTSTGNENIDGAQLVIGGLDERFQAQGLYRRRSIFVVDGEQGPLAVAFSEESTPGLNLIEKTNSFSLMVPRRDHPRVREALQALIQRCVEHARERGMPSAIALVDEEDIDALQAAGFDNLGRFSEWIVHRSMLRRCYELWRSVFERLGGEPAPEWTTEEAEE